MRFFLVASLNISIQQSRSLRQLDRDIEYLKRVSQHTKSWCYYLVSCEESQGVRFERIGYRVVIVRFPKSRSLMQINAILLKVGLRKENVIRTNQESSLIYCFGLLIARPAILVLRCGYSRSDFYQKQGRLLYMRLNQIILSLFRNRIGMLEVANVRDASFFPVRSKDVFVNRTYVQQEFLEQKSSSNDGDSYLLFIGRNAVQKRPERAVRLANALSTELVIVGKGFENLAVNEGERVRWIGVVDDNAILIDLIDRCQALVLLSDFEGTPKVVLEAIARGKKCILSDIEPHKDLHASFPQLTFLLKSEACELEDVSLKSDLLEFLGGYITAETSEQYRMHLSLDAFVTKEWAALTDRRKCDEVATN